MATIGNPWRMLNTVRTFATGQVEVFSEPFDAALDSDSDWTHPSWNFDSTASQGLPAVAGGLLNASSTINTELRTAMLRDVDPSTESYREITLHGIIVYSTNTTYFYFVLDSDGTLANTLYVRVAFAEPVSNIAIVQGGIGTLTSVDVIPPVPVGSQLPFSIRVAIDGGNTLRVYYRDFNHNPVSYNLGTYAAAGDRIGFGLRMTEVGARITAQSLSVKYFPSAGSLPATALVGVNGGLLYYESTNGNMIQVNSTLTLNDDEWLSSANRLQSLYIADFGIRSQNDAESASAANTTGTTATLTDTGATFTTDGVDAEDDMVEITAASDETKLGTYPISSVSSETAIVITGQTGSITGVSYRVMRAPKVFDSDDLTLTRLTASAGSVPPDCDIVAVFNDRICWAGDALVPEAVYMSKVGDPTDYDYGTGLSDEAWIYDPARQAGAPYIGDRVTALIPNLDDYLIIGAERSIWIQKGDPSLGVPPEAISREIGILKQSAWCYTPEGAIVAMTLDGLYLIVPANGSLQRLSRDRMPQELVGIDADLHDVLVEFDTLRNGVNIFVTPRDPAPTKHFWFGWQMKEFSPESYNQNFEPTAIKSHSLAGVGVRRVILGCRDGYLRVHEDSSETDDGENFYSAVLIGPIMLGGGGYYEGMIREVVGQLAEESGEVTMKIRIGDSVESAYNSTSRVSYVMRAGKNRTWRPNLRGNACFIELFSEGGEAWAFEQLSIVRERLGKQRLLA